MNDKSVRRPGELKPVVCLAPLSHPQLGPAPIMHKPHDPACFVIGWLIESVLATNLE